jgi:hypothetical protein
MLVGPYAQGVAAQEGDCMDGSTASNVEVLVVSLFGLVDDVKRTVSDPGVGGASALATPRSRFRGLT